MPHKAVQRQRPVVMAESRRLQQCEEAAQQIVGAEKGVDRAACVLLPHKICGQTQIHRDAAKLKGEHPPLKAAVSDHKVVKQQLVRLTDDQKQSYTE